MRKYAALWIAALTFVPPALAVDQTLVGNTLVCQATSQGGWRQMTYLYVTATHMFKQDATKDPSGLISGGGSSTGAVYQWNKRTSGTAGVVTFRTHATKGVGTLSYETRYRVPNALSDSITMDVVEQSSARLRASSWSLVVDRKQSSPNGPVAVPHQRQTYRCQVVPGRQLR